MKNEIFWTVCVDGWKKGKLKASVSLWVKKFINEFNNFREERSLVKAVQHGVKIN